VAADHSPILATGEDRLHEAELAEAAFEGVELVLADPPRVGRVRSEIVDRDLFDGERGEGSQAGHASRPPSEFLARKRGAPQRQRHAEWNARMSA
jgi:hypothetical protein